MNRYRYENLFVGMQESFGVTITEEMVDMFHKLSGDPNPLHINENYAQAHGFHGRVVYGMLTASMLSALGGGYLPGERCLIESIEVKFLRPVYIGDELAVRGTVHELHDSVRQVVLKVEMCNQHNEKVLRCVMKVGVLDE